jgi:hypothetical protein
LGSRLLLARWWWLVSTGSAHQNRRPLPIQIWHAFEALVALGVALGSLYGAGLVSGAVLLVAMLCILLAFVPWAVFQLDPRGLTDLRAYRNDRQK